MRTQKMLPQILILTGLILLVLMIVIEDEPGAIPLGMIAFGSAWLFITRNRLKQNSMD